MPPTTAFVAFEEIVLKRLVPFVAACAVVAMLATGCSKSSNSSDQGASSSASGPVTDSGSTGMKPAPEASGGVATGDATHGKAIFTQNCSSCHGADGTQGGVGPSLKNEKSRKDDAATIAWIKNPKPPMPKLYPSPLSEKDVADVAAYVQSL